MNFVKETTSIGRRNRKRKEASLEFTIVSGADILEMIEKKKKRRRARFDPDTNCIYIKVFPGHEYEVDMDRCTTAEEALDWIHQVCVTKTWGPKVSADFLEVLFDTISPKLWLGKM